MLIAATAGLLFVSGAAFAQSGQGGYTGKNPGTQSPSGSVQQPMQGSGQGGYLGTNPGASTSGSSGVTQSPGSGQGGAIGTNPSGPGGNPAYTGQQQPPYGNQQMPPQQTPPRR